MNCKLKFLDERAYVNTEHCYYHAHNIYELVYYIEGSGTMNIEGSAYNYQPSTYTLTVPNHYHNEIHHKKTSVLFINFTCGQQELSLSNGVYFDSGSKDIYSCLKEMKAELISKKIHYNALINNLLSRILIIHDRNTKGHSPKYYDFNYALEYIDEYYCQNINIRNISKFSGYSYDHFRHLFKQKTGFSPFDFVIRKRLKKAQQLLRASNISISEVVSQCGFASSSQFGLIFKRSTGKTPREYRNTFIF